jgi:hypothetical protein
MMMLGLLLASVVNIFVVESPSYTRQMVFAEHELATEHPELTLTISIYLRKHPEGLTPDCFGATTQVLEVATYAAIPI